MSRQTAAMTPHPSDEHLSRALVIPPDMDRLRARARIGLVIVAVAIASLIAGIVLTKAIANAAAAQVQEELR